MIKRYIIFFLVIIFILLFFSKCKSTYESSYVSVHHNIDTLIHPVKNTIVIKGSGIHYNDDKSIGLHISNDTVFIDKVQIVDHEVINSKQFKSLSIENHKLRNSHDSLVKEFQLLKTKLEVKKDSSSNAVKIAKVVNHVPNFWENLSHIFGQIKWILLGVLLIGILGFIAKIKKII